jgi:hypothetical protein
MHDVLNLNIDSIIYPLFYLNILHVDLIIDGELESIHKMRGAGVLLLNHD